MQKAVEILEFLYKKVFFWKNITKIMSDYGQICIDPLTEKDYFDEVIGNIEEIVMEDEFQSLQHEFMEMNWVKFETEEENKLIYMDIFKEYTNLLETFIINQLKQRMQNFDMERFAKDLEHKRPYLDGEIFELLFSLLDFVVFKEMILDYKAIKEGKHKDLELGITVKKIENPEG